jgi:hypothetical protein
MHVMQVLALLLIVVSALSFGLTIYLILTTDWNIERGGFDWYERQTNWFVGTESASIWGGEHYSWFLGYYYESFVVNDFSPFKSFYNPFPSVLGGIYFLICGIVFWKVKTENPAQWLNCRNMRDKQCVLRVSLLVFGGVLSLCLSMLSMYYQALDSRLNMVYPYQQYGFPLALLGILLLTLGTVGLYFVIMENPRLPRFLEPQPQQHS